MVEGHATRKHPLAGPGLPRVPLAVAALALSGTWAAYFLSTFLQLGIWLWIWLTVVWVAYFLVFFGTLLQRKESHIYVANWFYLAFIVTIAMLHIVNNQDFLDTIAADKKLQRPCFSYFGCGTPMD